MNVADECRVTMLNPGQTAYYAMIMQEKLQKNYLQTVEQGGQLVKPWNSEGEKELYRKAYAPLWDINSWHSFSFRPEVISLLQKTDNQVFARPMPFNLMMLPLQFQWQNHVVYCVGALTFNQMKRYRGSDPYEQLAHYMRMSEQIGAGESPSSEPLILLFSLQDIISPIGNFDAVIRYRSVSVTGYEHHLPEVWKKPYDNRIDKHLFKFIDTMFFNAVDFVNMPDVEYTVMKPKEGRAEKRAQRGKAPMLPRMVITLKGATKRYIYEVEQLGQGSSHSHRYWVRGHWRHLQSNYYRNKQGEAVWIAPFIRGHGILIQKQYELARAQANARYR